MSWYSATADSTTASLIGGSGSYADYTATTSAVTKIAPNANFLSVGLFEVTSTNNFFRIRNDEYAVRAAGGGVATGSSAKSDSVITSTSKVTIGEDADLAVESNALGNQRLYICASSNVASTDRVDLQTGTAVGGAGVSSEMTVNATNDVSIGKNVKLQSTGDILVGTYTTASVTAEGLSNTWGLAGIGSSHATAVITSTQNVTLGENVFVEAFGDVMLTAGDDPLGSFKTILAPIAIAHGYVTGLVGIPVVKAIADVESNATLAIGLDSRVRSGRNTTLSAERGDRIPSADGTSRGSAVFIPIKGSNSDTSSTGASKITVDGTVESGVFSRIEITIPDSKNVRNEFSNEIVINGKTDYGSVSPTSDVPVSATWKEDFLASEFASAYFDSTRLQSIGSASSATAVRTGTSEACLPQAATSISTLPPSLVAER